MKVIDLIHSRGNYAFVPSEKDSFDVGEIQPDKKIKGWWDYKALRIYEIQTDADKAHLDRSVEKARRFKAALTIVTNNSKVEEEIIKHVNGKFDCLNIGKEN